MQGRVFLLVFADQFKNVRAAFGRRAALLDVASQREIPKQGELDSGFEERFEERNVFLARSADRPELAHYVYLAQRSGRFDGDGDLLVEGDLAQIGKLAAVLVYVLRDGFDRSRIQYAADLAVLFRVVDRHPVAGILIVLGFAQDRVAREQHSAVGIEPADDARERAVGVKDILAPDPPVRIFRRASRAGRPGYGAGHIGAGRRAG